MIRVSVVSTKQLVRSSFRILACGVIFIILIIVLKYSNAHFSQTEIDANKCISYITDEITVMGNMDMIDVSKVKAGYILDSELKFSEYIVPTQDIDDEDHHNVGEFSSLEGDGETSNQDNNGVDSNEGNTNQVNTDGSTEQVNTGGSDIVVQDVPQTAQTEVVSSTYKPTYNYQVSGVKVRNETSYDLSTLNLSPSNVNIKNKNVVIFHTHTCESYTQTENNKYVASGNYRTTDLSHNVVRVGDVLQTYLNEYGFNVTHDKSYHDYPAYNGSYGRSLETVKNILSKSDKTDIVIDLHRDAMSDESYAPKVKIGDEYVSQIMFVIGTDGSGLQHDNWKNNLEFAIKVQKKADEMYPGLFKPIIVRNARYNQHLASCATIIEFGATGNTLEECEGAAKYLAKVLAEVD